MRCIMLGVMALFPATVLAQPRDTADALRSECNEAVRFIDGDKNANLPQGGACIAYVQGYRDAIVSTRVTGNVICIPKEVTAGQLARVVTAHLQANPKNLHLDRVFGMHAALLDAYACKPSR